MIGASIGLRARSLGMHVVGFDPDGEALALARQRGALDDEAPSFAALASDVRTLVLASPLEATLAQIAELRTIANGPALAFDVASVKEPVTRASLGLGGFVATHPLAGSERSGPGAARADLFDGKTWTIDASAEPGARAAVRALVAALGARPLEIESVEHDRTVALTSHLPQLVSVALGSLVGPRLGDGRTRELSATGLRSLLRLGGSSWPMWRAVLEANSVSVAQEVRRLAAILTEAAESLETHSVDALEARFSTARAAVERLADAATETEGAS